jgi:hypothetical protein
VTFFERSLAAEPNSVDAHLGLGRAFLVVGDYTSAKIAFGGGDTVDNFLNARVGGGVNYELENGYALNGSLDYRYRNYDDTDRRDDKDLRWNGAVNRTVGESNVAVGVRGRVSYRGNGDYRNDYGLFTNWRYRTDPDNQFTVGAEFLRRDYPNGPLRAQSRHRGADRPTQGLRVRVVAARPLQRRTVQRQFR